VLSAVDRGGRVYVVAELFEVSVSYIYKALTRRRLTGIATALPKCGRPGRKLDHHLDALVAHIAAHPDSTLTELVEWSTAERGVKVCIATMWATLEALGITLKKRPATPLSKSARMLWPRGKPGARYKPTSTSIGLSSSTRPGRQPT